MNDKPMTATGILNRKHLSIKEGHPFSPHYKGWLKDTLNVLLSIIVSNSKQI